MFIIYFSLFVVGITLLNLCLQVKLSTINLVLIGLNFAFLTYHVINLTQQNEALLKASSAIVQ